MSYTQFMRIYIAHAGSFDYQKKLYEPIRRSPLFQQHEFIFPHAETTDGKHSKDVIESCDLVLAEVSEPSLGEGIELGWANAAGIQIVCVHETDAEPSSSIHHVSGAIHTYTNAEELLRHIESHL